MVNLLVVHTGVRRQAHAGRRRWRHAPCPLLEAAGPGVHRMVLWSVAAVCTPVWCMTLHAAAWPWATCGCIAFALAWATVCAPVCVWFPHALVNSASSARGSCGEELTPDCGDAVAPRLSNPICSSTRPISSLLGNTASAKLLHVKPAFRNQQSQCSANGTTLEGQGKATVGVGRLRTQLEHS